MKLELQCRFSLAIGSALLGLTLIAVANTNSGFRFGEVSKTSLGLWENDRPVFVYNHGTISKAGVPRDRNRSTYVHPLYGLDGEILTDDFPKDHFHHRGLFWAWPHVKVGSIEHDLWALQGIEQRFERWTERSVEKNRATLGIESGWYVGGKRVMGERVRLITHGSDGAARAIDVELSFVVGDEPITLQGAEGKSYGGLTLRYAPRTNTVITTPLGTTPKDLSITRLAWADLTAQFENRSKRSGAAVFIKRDHPNYPPEWLTRHYGVLCVGWPGVTARTFHPKETIRCSYRIFIHRDQLTTPKLEQIYRTYTDEQR